MSFNVRVGRVGVDVGRHVIYCGRAGRGEAGTFGNPFRTGRDGTREEVIAKHAAWFDAPEQHELRGELIRAVERKHKNGCTEVVLACFCHPRTCHCDRMASYLNNLSIE